MPALNLIGWICSIIAAIGVIATFGSRDPIVASTMMTMAISGAISAVLFFAMDKALTILAEIRDRLPAPAGANTDATGTIVSTANGPEKPLRSMAEIEADLAKMRGKNLGQV